jgi:hypothetical protein
LRIAAFGGAVFGAVVVVDAGDAAGAGATGKSGSGDKTV